MTTVLITSVIRGRDQLVRKENNVTGITRLLEMITGTIMGMIEALEAITLLITSVMGVVMALSQNTHTTTAHHHRHEVIMGSHHGHDEGCDEASVLKNIIFKLITGIIK